MDVTALDSPLVSVVVPVFNEALHISKCLESVRRQSYPAELIEIIVADGGSSDETRRLVAEMATNDPRIRLVDNPRRNQAAGLNIAIGESQGQVIARLDGHAEWPAEHLERCVRLLQVTEADSVGGTMDAVGTSSFTDAVACATTSPFGVGGARYRYATQVQEVDTVWLGCFRREALDRVGPFDERFPPHEDYELNHRIRATGGRILFSPDLPTRYWVRTSWTALARQYFRYGRAKARVAREVRGVLRPYHLAPPALVALLILAAGALLVPSWRPVAAWIFAGYALLCLGAGLVASRGRPPLVMIQTPAVLAVLHVSWGAGFWAGLVSPRPKEAPLSVL